MLLSVACHGHNKVVWVFTCQFDFIHFWNSRASNSTLRSKIFLTWNPTLPNGSSMTWESIQWNSFNLFLVPQIAKHFSPGSVHSKCACQFSPVGMMETCLPLTTMIFGHDWSKTMHFTDNPSKKEDAPPPFPKTDPDNLCDNVSSSSWKTQILI